MFGSGDQKMMRAVVRDCNIRDIEWLGVNQTVHWIYAELAKFRRVDVASGQDGFRRVLASARYIIVISQHVGGGVHCQDCNIAGSLSPRIAHHNAKLRSAVRRFGCGGSVAGRCRPHNWRTPLLPLVTQRR